MEYRYNKQKKRTDKVTIGLLGKITEDGFVLSKKNMLKQQTERSVDPSKVDIRMFGVFDFYSKSNVEVLNGNKFEIHPSPLPEQHPD